MDTEAAWREKLRNYIRAEAKPREKFGHQPRLYSLAREIAKGLEYDDDIVFAAIWLHDLGVFIGHRPEALEDLVRWDSVTYAMQRAPEILRRIGFPPEKIKAVVEAIRTHQPANDPNSLEGIVVRDADILEQLGAIGILRTVCKVGRDTRFADFTDAVTSLRRALKELPQNLRLDSAKALAQPKIETLRLFLEAVDAEAHGALG